MSDTPKSIILTGSVAWLVERDALREALDRVETLHPAKEWTEADGVVLWWLERPGLAPAAEQVRNALPRLYLRQIDPRYQYWWSRLPNVRPKGVEPR